MKNIKLVALLALVAVACAAFPQQGGAAGSGNQSGRRTGAGRAQRMFGGGFGGPEMLLVGGGFGGGRGGGGGNAMRDAVIDDLKLTDEQKGKLDTVRSDSQKRMQEAFQKLNIDFSSGPPDAAQREQITKTMTPLMEQTNKDVDAVLTADQLKRLHQIWVQTSGNRILANKDVAKELGLTDEQNTKVADLIKKAAEANQALRDNEDLDRQDRQDRMQNNNKVLDTELAKVLTVAQQTKLKEMQGPPFKRPEGQGG